MKAMSPPIKKNQGLALRNSKGFSLIELLVATAILAGVSLVSVQLLWDTLSTRSKQYSIEGSTDNVRLLVSDLTKAIQGAKSVTIIDSWTIQIVGSPPNPCQTVILNDNQQMVRAIDSNHPCSPPLPSTGSFSPMSPEAIIITNKQSSLPFFSPIGNFSNFITIKIKGVYQDSLGEHPFDYQTTVTPRVTI